MDIVKYTSRCESGSEIVMVNFPDDIMSRGKKSNIPSPRSAWIDLADEKARQQKIDFIYDYTETGLEVEFHSKEDCDAVLAAMAPELKQKLIEGFDYLINVIMTSGYENEYGQYHCPKAFKRSINKLALQYDVTIDEITAVHPVVNDLMP